MTISVIACDKREAFAQGSVATKQSNFLCALDGLLRFARNDGESRHFPSHFGGRFSENAFGPSM